MIVTVDEYEFYFVSKRQYISGQDYAILLYSFAVFTVCLFIYLFIFFCFRYFRYSH
jgi:hypothetical protein